MFADHPYVLRALVCLALLTGCSQQASDPGPAPPSLHDLVPAQDGLDVTASGGRQIGFGRDRQGVLDTVGRVTGMAPRPVDCAAPGRTAYGTGDGLTLVFEGGTFVGWQTATSTAGRTCG